MIILIKLQLSRLKDAFETLEKHCEYDSDEESKNKFEKDKRLRKILRKKSAISLRLGFERWIRNL